MNIRYINIKIFFVYLEKATLKYKYFPNLNFFNHRKIKDLYYDIHFKQEYRNFK